MYDGTFNSQLDPLDLSNYALHIPGSASVVTYNEQSKWGGGGWGVGEACMGMRLLMSGSGGVGRVYVL